MATTAEQLVIDSIVKFRQDFDASGQTHNDYIAELHAHFERVELALKPVTAPSDPPAHPRHT